MRRAISFSFLLIAIGILIYNGRASSPAAKSLRPRPDASYWQAVPAKDSIPAFRYHLDGHGSSLHVELQLPAELDPDRFNLMGRLFKTGPRDGIQLRFFYGTLAVQGLDKKELLKLDLSSKGEEDFELLDLQKVNNGYVLLMIIAGYSRPHAIYGYCGGGLESNLVWVLLGSDLKLQKKTSFLINSCFESANSHDEMKKTPGQWSWDVDNFQKKTKFHIQYNPQKRLDGLDIRSTPMN